MARRLPLLLGACVTVALATTAPAHAATVTQSGPTLTFTAATGEANSVLVEKVGTRWHIHDDGATITAPAFCTPVAGSAGREVDCATTTGGGAPANLTSLRLVLGDQDDRTRVAGAVPTVQLGGSGRDTLIGGSAVDNLLAGKSTGDRLTGGTGDDTLDATESVMPELLDGGDGTDVLKGGLRPPQGSFTNGIAPRLLGGAGNDTITGGTADEGLFPGTGSDILRGGAGFDLASFDQAAVALTITVDSVKNDGPPATPAETDDVGTDIEAVLGGAGNDTITGSSAANLLLGGPGNDTLKGVAGNDHLCGEGIWFNVAFTATGGGCFTDGTALPSDDTLEGGDGDDLLGGGRGADTHVGGAGSDTAWWGDHLAPVRVDIDAAVSDDGVQDDPATPANEAEGDTAALGVENLVGGQRDDRLTGGNGASIVLGGFGNDVLLGALSTATVGDDTLCGDALFNGAVAVPAVGTVPVCGNSSGPPGPPVPSDDVLSAGAGDDWQQGGPGADTFTGGLGQDTVSYETSFPNGFQLPGVTVDLDTLAAGVPGDDGAQDDPAVPGDGAEHDYVRVDNENLVGTSQADSLTGNTASNLLMGGFGNDALSGGTGNDFLVGESGADVFNGGADVDYVSYEQQPYFFGGVTVDIDTLPAATPGDDGHPGEQDYVKIDVEGLLGTDADDSLVGSSGANTLFGLSGTDSLNGGSGNDVLNPGDGLDLQTVGGTGDDRIDLRDGTIPESADCGTHVAGDRLVRDASDAAGIGCETTVTYLRPGGDAEQEQLEAQRRAARRLAG